MVTGTFRAARFKDCRDSFKDGVNCEPEQLRGDGEALKEALVLWDQGRVIRDSDGRYFRISNSAQPNNLARVLAISTSRASREDSNGYNLDVADVRIAETLAHTR